MPKRRIDFTPAFTGWYWRPARTPWPTIGSDTVARNCAAFGYEDLQISEGHKVSDLGKTRHDIGGKFKTIGHSYREGVNSKRRVYGNSINGPNPGSYVYDGGFYAQANDVTNANFPASQESSEAQMIYWGTKAVALTIPTNPLFDAATFVGELSEGIPRIAGTDFFKSRSALAKSAGSEYLNVEFGWMPLVSDVRAFSYAVKNSDEILAQYERNSGKRIKRRLEFPVEKSTSISESTSTGDCWPKPQLFNGIVSSQASKWVKTTTVERSRWFSGCFTYYLPPVRGSGAARFVAEANKLYGIRLTPETLWNLTPWSWGADWFGNIGDVMHNLSMFSQDGLVMPYGYIMETTIVRDVYELFDVRFFNYPTSHYFVQEFTTTAKTRYKATPYGFGLNPNSFTGRQWAIAAALGLSKGGGSLSW